jgi:hypothetical protein
MAFPKSTVTVRNFLRDVVVLLLGRFLPGPPEEVQAEEKARKRPKALKALEISPAFGPGRVFLPWPVDTMGEKGLQKGPRIPPKPSFGF